MMRHINRFIANTVIDDILNHATLAPIRVIQARIQEPNRSVNVATFDNRIRIITFSERLTDSAPPLNEGDYLEHFIAMGIDILGRLEMHVVWSGYSGRTGEFIDAAHGGAIVSGDRVSINGTWPDPSGLCRLWQLERQGDLSAREMIDRLTNAFIVDRPLPIRPGRLLRCDYAGEFVEPKPRGCDVRH